MDPRVREDDGTLGQALEGAALVGPSLFLTLFSREGGSPDWVPAFAGKQFPQNFRGIRIFQRDTFQEPMFPLQPRCPKPTPARKNFTPGTFDMPHPEAHMPSVGTR